MSTPSEPPTNHDFTLVLDRLPNEEESDVLFESSCGDASLETRGGGARVHFTRYAPAPVAALVTAIRSVERAGFRGHAVNSENTAADSVLQVRNLFPHDPAKRAEFARMLSA